MYTAKGTLQAQPGIENYLPMVRRTAHRMIGRLPANVEVDDLIQAGVMGLMEAMERYEQGHGAQFETFALQRVRGAMLDELRGTDWVPRSVRKHQREIADAVHALEQKLQRAPSDSEIAAHMGVTLAEYHEMLVDVRGAQLVYTDDYDSDENDTHYLDRHVTPDERGDPAAQLADRRFREALVAAIGDLPEREQYVMSMYYEHDMNLKEIAAVLGVTESRVCQLHSQAVARLRSRLKAW
ncbi:MAG TPA: RNA polymerase sigma factor FliA [Ramlibacter sp.]|jgi:RNA polymerase sigma factor for flagellar operon FliA|uniref:RNA polymerase sigma factor FliA n=1 Tax=Ramlibacter sp. TaxID=1917967 RepID=UPI002D625F0A|nr:RNA polymerase sigma factor FliA [Ramlibacter sp.]HZY19136.1 RNA polymerase sigma factor FliA [Ramlibacter sp.]